MHQVICEVLVCQGLGVSHYCGLRISHFIVEHGRRWNRRFGHHKIYDSMQELLKSLRTYLKLFCVEYKGTVYIQKDGVMIV